MKADGDRSDSGDQPRAGRRDSRAVHPQRDHAAPGFAAPCWGFPAASIRASWRTWPRGPWAAKRAGRDDALQDLERRNARRQPGRGRQLWRGDGRRADHGAGRRLFRGVSRRLADAAGQQVCPRADDRALRPERRLRGPGGGHEQQERAAVGLRHAVWRHGLGHQPDRRPVQDAVAPTGGPPGRAAADSRQGAQRRPVGRPDRRGRAGLHLCRGRPAVGAAGRSPLAARRNWCGPASTRRSSTAC